MCFRRSEARAETISAHASRVSGEVLTKQGWDRADFHCGRCGEHITATTEEQYIVRVTAHRTAHDLLDASGPELRARLIDLALLEIETKLTT